MTTDKPQAALDAVADWISAYRTARDNAAKWSELANRARSHITEALGDAEVGLLAGNPVVRHTFVHKQRVNLPKLRAEHPDLVEQFTTAAVERRFTLIDDKD
jgi:predicted phage-related endonuclease